MTQRGGLFFQMYLAHELKMTRRELLNRIDSRELTMWRAYFTETNTKPADKPDSPELLSAKLKSAFLGNTKKGKK